MICFLLLTAFTVSIDSLVCGFSLSLSHKKKLPIILTITLTVLVMCFITNYLAILLSKYIDQKATGVGGLLLIAIGVYNLCKKDKNTPEKDTTLFKQSLLVGVAVGLDGAVANLSLAIMGINAFYVPVIIAIMHGIMIAIGICLTETKIIKKLGSIRFIAPIILILLGTYKLVGVFL